MAQTNEESNEIPATVRPSAPVPPAPQQWIMPRHKRIEGDEGFSSPVVNRYPQVRGGICEYCGVIDPRLPSTEQYKLCEHYRGQELFCVYCPKNGTNSREHITGHTVYNIYDHPDDPSKLLVFCDAYECNRKNNARFKLSR